MIESNGLIYDENDELCKIYVCVACGQKFAFIQVIDSGGDGRQRWTKRYWGPYEHRDHDRSIRQIMETGGKWPDLASCKWPTE